MALKSIISFAHALLEDAVTPGDTVIDCTMGNGNDTLFLANLVGKAGHVLAFDIQESALENTKKRLEQHGIADTQVSLIQASHADLAQHIPAGARGKVKAAIFNLGYLLGGDKQICTLPHTTIAALEALRSAVAAGGMIVLVVYPGHAEGEREASEVLEYCKHLPRDEMNVVAYQILNNPNSPPFVIALEKRGVE